MSECDDMTTLAFSYLRNSVDTERDLGPRFANVPRAPLARLIDGYLEQHPDVETSSMLRKVASLNQGRLEDLNVATFVSYLVAKCGSDEASLRNIINTLHAYQSVTAVALEECEEELLVAARDEAPDGPISVTLADLREQLKKRVQ